MPVNAKLIEQELSARLQQGAVLRRLRASRGVFATLLGREMPGGIRGFVEETFRLDRADLRWSYINGNAERIGPLFEKLGEGERRRLTAALLPEMAPAVDATWSLLARRPYPVGMTRRPFRCPRSPATLAVVRGRWLLTVAALLGDYRGDVVWLAEWAPHLAQWWGADEIGWLLAGALDAGGPASDRVLDVLRASAAGEHPVGQMGRHVVRALLSSARPEAWEYAEKLLLAAQRQEGLRQSILESVDEAHPEAFRRMLRLVLEHDLSRFSSVVRAVDMWFGFQWSATSGGKVDEILERTAALLEDDSLRRATLAGSDPEHAYLALWCTAFRDVDEAVPAAARLLASPSEEIRFVAAHLLTQVQWTSAYPPLQKALDDASLPVAVHALVAFAQDATNYVDGARLFDAIEALLARLPARSQSLEAVVWPWTERTVDRTQVTGALAANAARVPVQRLIPHVRDMAPFQRAQLVRRAAGLPSPWMQEPRGRPWLEGAARPMVLELLGDASAEVRGAAFEALGDEPPGTDEVERLLDLLSRRAGDLRSGALERLRRLPDAELLDAADRLVADAEALRRQAGLELLRDAAERGRAVDAVRRRMDAFRDRAGPVSEAEQAQIDAVLGEAAAATREDALGLSAGERAWPPPRPRAVTLDTSAARAAVESLAELVLAHEKTEVEGPTGDRHLLLESWVWGPRAAAGVAEAEERLPLHSIWHDWADSRPAATCDPDGLELFRALMAGPDSAVWKGPQARRVTGSRANHPGQQFLRTLLEWSAYWQAPAGVGEFLIDGLEGALAALSASDLAAIRGEAVRGRVISAAEFFARQDAAHAGRRDRAVAWYLMLRWWRSVRPEEMRPESAARVYALLRWYAQQTGGGEQMTVMLPDFVGAFRTGLVVADDLAYLLLGPGSEPGHASLLRQVSTRRPPAELAADPSLLAVVERCRRRLVEVECGRGDRTTAASRHVIELRWTGGLETLARALPALGATHFARSRSWRAEGVSRQDALSHLVLRSQPRTEDTPQAFAAWARQAKLKDSRLVELAAYAPQWARHVEEAVGWPGLETAVWWMTAHTRDDRSWDLQELKEAWTAEVSQHTPLVAGDLTEGAVDVAWFREARERLGPARWKQVETAAKYGSSAGGHSRAQLFSRAMAGEVTREALEQRIASSRHQDSVRALGLVPLPDGEARPSELLARYRALQEFRRQSRRFGSQRQQSEGRAVAVALDNLARTAGYRDPQRLQWAMEREAVADLVAGAVVREVSGVTATLRLAEGGVPELRFARGEKPLKSAPSAVAKNPEMVELKERVRDLRRQASRVRGALEEAMCRGDRFTRAELEDLFGHPMLRPALERLVFVGDDAAGYPLAGGLALRDASGAVQPLGSEDSVRIAHPYELFRRGDWPAWQRECFRAERVQPFKQVFRELYPMLETEAGASLTRRYAGHQVQPRQALALLGTRGWVAHPEEGVTRTFHEARLTARLAFQESFFTPADVEGLTLEAVVFSRKGSWEELPLSEVPPVVFSEAMRDLDLVVSVAHAGGVDPEATASTVEMRAALLRETCALLGLGNVEVRANHAVVRGELATYAVHLGSAGASVMPGAALFITAVHSQHRGRIFLPFADDDPRTAEVMSKVLLLARDRQIRDPNILDQIRAALPILPNP